MGTFCRIECYFGLRQAFAEGRLPLAKRQKRQSSKTGQSADLLARKLSRPALIFERDDLVLLLRAAVEREGNQGAFAKRAMASNAPASITF
jgi:hypothetical protein